MVTVPCPAYRSRYAAWTCLGWVEVSVAIDAIAIAWRLTHRDEQALPGEQGEACRRWYPDDAARAYRPPGWAVAVRVLPGAKAQARRKPRDVELAVAQGNDRCCACACPETLMTPSPAPTGFATSSSQPPGKASCHPPTRTSCGPSGTGADRQPGRLTARVTCWPTVRGDENRQRPRYGWLAGRAAVAGSARAAADPGFESQSAAR